MRSICIFLTIAITFGVLGAHLFGDEITYREDGNTYTIQARMIGSGQGFQALERADGQLAIVPNAAIQERIPKDDPEPIDAAGMEELLKKKFGADLVRTEQKKPFLVALVLASPIEKSSEARAGAFLKKASRFMYNVDNVFMKYARSMRFPVQDPRYPMVLLIFESDEDFNKYASEATGGNGLSSNVIAGFYSGLTNWLAVRMSSCDTYEVPLHEAIHQQMYNRVFTRLSPIPKWFDEGIATGFESNGDRIDTNPARVNKRYARQAKQLSRNAKWENVVADDGAFTADVLAGDAYTLAWCMHWMLATQHKDEYREYVQELAKRPSLELLESSERTARFEAAFGVSVSDLQRDFPRALEANLKRQRINLDQADTKGRSRQQQALGEVDVQAVRRLDLGGQLEAAGTIKNISPLRTMTFYITLETGSGIYTDWLIPNLRPGQKRPLPKQIANKRSPNAANGDPGTYRVWVRSSPSQSDRAKAWNSGQVPGPSGS